MASSNIHAPCFKPFWDSIYERSINIQYAKPLFEYFVLGKQPQYWIHYQPLLENDLAGALHGFNNDELEQLQEIVFWLCEATPQDSWGNRRVVKDWLELSDDARYEILHDFGLVLAPEQVVWNILQESA